MGRWLGKLLARQANPPPGFFASVGGSASGTGSYYDPWDLQTALYGGPGGSAGAPAADVQPGDTVWLRGGTYTGQFICAVVGTAGNYITFRGYPGERAIIDGNYDNSVTGNNGQTLIMHNWGAYQIFQDIEITNSQVDRLCSPWFDQSSVLGGKDGDARAPNLFMLANHSKVINCFLHDGGMGISPSSGAEFWEVNGCLSYYNGNYAPYCEPDQAVSVDLVPAGGVAVATSGVYHSQQTGATSITISNHINAGNYTIVGVKKNGPDPSTVTATFDGAAMTLLNWISDDSNGKSVAIFGLKGHTVTANVVVASNDSYTVKAIAQSFVNVNQNANEHLNAVCDTLTVTDGAMTSGSATLTSVTGGFTSAMVGRTVSVPGAGASGTTLWTYVQTYTDPNTLQLSHTSGANVSGKTVSVYANAWFNNQWCNTREGSTPGTVSGSPAIHYNVGATIASNTNHMVVDAMAMYTSYSASMAPSGDNAGNKIGGTIPDFGTQPLIMLSTATRTGAGTVNMQWGWDMIVRAHGHGSYVQSGGSVNVGTTSGVNTITGPSGTWSSEVVGGQIRIQGAGVAGATYTTTISVYNSTSSIDVLVAPSTSLGSTEANWSFGSIFKDNMFWDNVSEVTQFYGSGGAAANGIAASGNMWAISPAFFGGLGGFRMADTSVHDNYFWSVSTNLGDACAQMRNFAFQNNYCHNMTFRGNLIGAWTEASVTGNTIIAGCGTGFDTDFPTNDYTYLASNPVTNLIVVRPNDYEANRANIYVYNWEGLLTVDVDLDTAVSNGVAIRVMNARDYFGTPVYTGTYTTGVPVTLPMTGLTVATAIGGPGGNPSGTFTPAASTAPDFAAFIVRAQSAELWR